MIRVLSLTRCVVWVACLAPAARAQLPGSPGPPAQLPGSPGPPAQLPGSPGPPAQLPGSPGPPAPTSAELHPLPRPADPPQDTIEMINQSGATERTSPQDRPGLDPYDPDLKHATLLKATPSDKAREHEKTPNKWFGKSTRCTATEGTTAAEGGQASGDGSTGGAPSGNSTSTIRKHLKNSLAPYKGANTGPPEEHFVDDA